MSLIPLLNTDHLLIAASCTITNTDLKRYGYFDCGTAGMTIVMPTPCADLSNQITCWSENSGDSQTLSGIFASGVTATMAAYGTYFLMCVRVGADWKWKLANEVSVAVGVPVVATGAEVTTGTNNTKFASPKALADALITATPVKASAAETTTGVNDAKFVTPAALAGSEYALLSEIPAGTMSSFGTMVAAGQAKATPIVADLVPVVDTADSNIMKKVTWTVIQTILFTVSWLGGLINGADAKASPIAGDSVPVVDSVDSNKIKRTTITQLTAVVAPTATTIGTLINGATAKNPPIDADLFPIKDSVGGLLNSVTGTVLKAYLLTSATIGSLIHAATVKATPVDADYLGYSDSAGSWALKYCLMSDLKAFLKTYFDTIYNPGLAVAAFSGTLSWSGGSPTVTSEVYRQKTIGQLCFWKAHVVGTDGKNATTCMLTFPAGLVPTNVSVKIPTPCQVSVNNGAFTNVLATLDCKDGTPANRKLTIAVGTLTNAQPFEIIAEGRHEIS